MKTLLTLANCLLVGISAFANEGKEELFPLANGEFLRLDYDASARGESTVLSLYLKSGESEILVDGTQAKHQIYANGVHGLQPYEKCSIVAAVHHSGQLAVLYALEDGRQQVVGVNHAQRGYAKPVKLDRDLLLVSYLRKNNKWTTEVSVYIQTIFGDIFGEKISGVKIAGGDKYEVVFSRKWKIEGTKSVFSDSRKKVALPSGKEVKTITFDRKSQLIFATAENGGKFFTRQTVWWTGTNNDYIEKARLRSDARRRAEYEARAKGVRLPVEEPPLIGKLKAGNIRMVDLSYISDD